MVSLHAAVMAMALSGAGQTVLLDFYSDNCGPCRAMDPTVQALIAKGYPIKRVNVDRRENASLVAQYKVHSWPCFVMVVDGQEVDRTIGGTSHFRLEQMCLKGKPQGRPDFPPLLALAGPKAANANALATASPTPIPNAVQPSGATSVPAARPAPAAMPAMLPQQPATLSQQQNAAAPSPWQGSSPAAVVTPVAFQREVRQVSDAQLIAASVRLRVADPNGFSCGSGTIIHTRGDKALILTCGHIFRDSQGQGKVEVDLFGPNGPQRVLGFVESFDSEKSDVGLVSIRVPGPVAAMRVAPLGYRLNPGQQVISVGCNNGEEPTARHSQVSSLGPANGQGPAYIWVADQPVEGRSGGGLFSPEGYVIGICNAADPNGKEGYYASLGSIYAELDRPTNPSSPSLSFVYNTPAETPNPAANNNSVVPANTAIPANAVIPAVVSAPFGAPTSASPSASPIPSAIPAMPSAMPGTATAASSSAPQTPQQTPNMPGAMPEGLSPAALAAAGSMAATGGLPPHEQSAWNDIKHKAKQGASVVCIVNNPDGQSEVYMLDNVSQEFRKQIAAETRVKNAPYQTSSREPPQRKTIFQWSADPRTPSPATSNLNAAWKAETR